MCKCPLGTWAVFHPVGAGAQSVLQCSVELICRMFPCSCSLQVARPRQRGSVVRGALHLWHRFPEKSEGAVSSVGGFDDLGFLGQIAVL